MKIFLFVFLNFIVVTVIAQGVKPLGIALENFDYPYPVDYIRVNVQGEKLNMAYMNVRPKKPNGKTVMLMHGKNFCGAYFGQTAKDLLIFLKK